MVVALSVVGPTIAADDNIRPYHAVIGLSRSSNVAVVRLMNDAGTVRYFLELYMNAWDLDGIDDHLGGSLCIRISQACGPYLRGTLMCQEGASRTDRPEDCPGVLTSDMLDKAFADARKGVPLVFTGSSMRITITLKDLRFSEQAVAPGDERRVDLLEFDIDIVPDKSANKSKHFTRTPAFR
jgi:hypothetical protein